MKSVSSKDYNIKEEQKQYKTYKFEFYLQL